MCYLKCTTRRSFVAKYKTEGHRRRCVLRYDVLLSSSLYLLGFRILVFNLQQKREEGERLLHYLQQTNIALATCTLIYAINQETCGNEIKCLKSLVFSEVLGCVS